MTRSWSAGRRWTLAAAVLAVLAGPPAAASAQAPPCTPGAPGAGDTYYPGNGNGGYDVRRYDLEVAYDPATDVLEGRATIRARALQSLCSFNLDLVGLDVHSVRVDDRRATWLRSGQELTITPRRPLRDARRFRVVVRYSGVPEEVVIPGDDLRSGFMATDDGANVVGQPEVAATWFPVNDHPTDKAAYSFDVTVPPGYEVAANGLLWSVDRRPLRTTWRWDAHEPMAPYLATIDIGFWDIHRWRTEDGLPVWDAVDPALTGGLREEIDSSLARQGEILDVLEERFGPYPFSTVGAIVDAQDDLFFALETQTRPVYSKVFWLGAEGEPVNGDSVVVHELAHQWFGDDLALGRWQDIWLNEGFATYAEFLWAEHEGQATPQEIFEAIYDGVPADDPFWQVVIGDPGVDLLFDGAVYFRGAMTLQALRNEVGDDVFWAIIRGWAATHSGGNVTTTEFIAFAERIAGRELDQVFDTWLFTAGKPALDPAPEPSQRSAAASAGAAEWLAAARRALAVGPH
jgi:aminopeptidase N